MVFCRVSGSCFVSGGTRLRGSSVGSADTVSVKIWLGGHFVEAWGLWVMPRWRAAGTLAVRRVDRSRLHDASVIDDLELHLVFR